MMDEKKAFIVKKEKDRLIILIDHWIRHNREHMAEYLRLAERLEPEGLFEIASRIKEASGLILKANDSLSAARNSWHNTKTNLISPKNWSRPFGGQCPPYECWRQRKTFRHGLHGLTRI